jgi:hypothetical protein
MVRRTVARSGRCTGRHSGAPPVPAVWVVAPSSAYDRVGLHHGCVVRPLLCLMLGLIGTRLIQFIEVVFYFLLTLNSVLDIRLGWGRHSLNYFRGLAGFRGL